MGRPVRYKSRRATTEIPFIDGTVELVEPAEPAANTSIVRQVDRPYARHAEKLVASLEDGHSMAHASKLCGVNRNTFESWRVRYAEFKELTDRAFLRGADYYIEAIRKAMDGEHKVNPAYVAMGLKLRGLLEDKRQLPPEWTVDVKILNAGKDSIARALTKRTNRHNPPPRLPPGD